MSTSGASASRRLRLPPPAQAYDSRSEIERNRALESADRANLKRFEDVDLTNNERLILVSANGTRYSLVVSNAGVLSTSAV